MVETDDGAHLDYARALADRRRARNVEFTPLNVLSDAWPTDFDVVTCSLFLHHLTDDDAEQLMRRIAAEQMLLASSTTEGNNGGNIRSSAAAIERWLPPRMRRPE